MRAHAIASMKGDRLILGRTPFQAVLANAALPNHVPTGATTFHPDRYADAGPVRAPRNVHRRAHADPHRAAAFPGPLHAMGRGQASGHRQSQR